MKLATFDMLATVVVFVLLVLLAIGYIVYDRRHPLD